RSGNTQIVCCIGRSLPDGPVAGTSKLWCVRAHLSPAASDATLRRWIERGEPRMHARTRLLAGLLATALMLIAGANVAQAERRVALVIGNSAYEHVPAL